MTAPQSSSATLGSAPPCRRGTAAWSRSCSPAAAFVIGVALPVDGGFTAH